MELAQSRSRVVGAIVGRWRRWLAALGAVGALSVIGAGPVAAQTVAAPPVPNPAFPKLFRAYAGINGYEDLVMAGDLVELNHPLEIAERTEATLKEMRQALEDPDVDRAMKLLHAGLDKPIQSPRDPNKVDEETLLPEFAGFRRLARVLAIQEQVELADGEVSRAIDTMRDGLRLSFIIQSELLIGGLVGVAIDAIVLNRFAPHFDQMALRDCYHVTGVSQEWLKLPSPVEAILAMENKSLHNILDKCRSDPARLRTLAEDSEPDSPPTSDDEMAALELSDYLKSGTAAIGPMLDQAEALADALLRAQVAEIRKPPWQRKPLPKFESRRSMAHRLCSMLAPVYSQALQKFDDERATIQLLGVHGAIRRFRWENNRLPTSLAELKLPSLTTDPFTGGSLAYKPSGDRYELSSAGGGNGPVTLPRQAR